MKILLIILLLFLLLTITILIISFYKTFYSKNEQIKSKEIILPNNPVYNKYKDIITKDILDVRKLNPKQYYIKSFDGLILAAKYYENFKNAPIEIMFHGYRGSSERDLSSGVRRAKACGHNVLLVDQRASGLSQGHVISFGINEHKDCLNWIKFVNKKFGSNTKIILTGISMGAATVMMATKYTLPKNVIGVIADCGYNSPKNIIKKVIKDMKLPPNLLYPFVSLSARIFGNFNLNELSPLSAVKKSKTPIIFFHGEADEFIPYIMSEELYNECSSKKELFIVPNADHGISYLIEPERYVDYVKSFFSK